MTSFSVPRTTVTPQQLLSEQVRRILAAPVYDLAIETPLQAAPALSASWVTKCCSSAKTCSLPSRSRSAAPIPACRASVLCSVSVG